MAKPGRANDAKLWGKRVEGRILQDDVSYCILRKVVGLENEGWSQEKENSEYWHTPECGCSENVPFESGPPTMLLPVTVRCWLQYMGLNAFCIGSVCQPSSHTHTDPTTCPCWH